VEFVENSRTRIIKTSPQPGPSCESDCFACGSVIKLLVLCTFGFKGIGQLNGLEDKVQDLARRKTVSSTRRIVTHTTTIITRLLTACQTGLERMVLADGRYGNNPSATAGGGGWEVIRERWKQDCQLWSSVFFTCISCWQLVWPSNNDQGGRSRMLARKRNPVNKVDVHLFPGTLLVCRK
jgi:hypothetical protein